MNFWNGVSTDTIVNSNLILIFIVDRNDRDAYGLVQNCSENNQGLISLFAISIFIVNNFANSISRNIAKFKSKKIRTLNLTFVNSKIKLCTINKDRISLA